MIILVKRTNQKNHMSFMPHVLSRNEHPSSQCGHFNQVDPFKNHDFVVLSRVKR
jgi:hypothetical protein